MKRLTTQEVTQYLSDNTRDLTELSSTLCMGCLKVYVFVDFADCMQSAKSTKTYMAHPAPDTRTSAQ